MYIYLRESSRLGVERNVIGYSELIVEFFMGLKKCFVENGKLCYS